MRTDRTEDSSTPVVIVGAGPVGLSLALGLARQGVRSVLLERKPTTSAHSKAPGIHVRTREIFRQWGIEERFLEAGVLRRTLTVHSAVPGRRPLASFDFSDLDTEADRPGLLILEQGEIERLLLEAVRESGMCEVRFGAEVVGLVAEGDRPELTVHDSGGEHLLEAEFVVGCDGAGSFVRGALGLPFEGITYSNRPMLADIRVEDERDELPWPRYFNGRTGLTFTFRLRPQLWRIVRLERGEATEDEDVPEEEELRRRVDEVLGGGPFGTVWASRFRIHRRSSPRFRVGRVLLAGDAAHVHSPAGGLGMNGGIQDAHNLAWKLAYALQGGDIDRLLDSYDVERKAVVVENVSRYTDLNTRIFLQTPSIIRTGAFFLFRSMLRVPGLRRRSLRRMTMIDLDYPPSPLLDARERSAGVRLPNPVLRSRDGAAVRLYDLLPGGPVILDVTGDRELDDLPVEVIRIGPGGYRDPSGSLHRLLGQKRDGWVLVRPDAHVAWARDRTENVDEALRYALGAQMDRRAREQPRR